MTVNVLAKQITPVLERAGFLKKKSTWNRKVGEFVDILDIQSGKDGSAVTINVGVLYPSVYEKCWEQNVPAFVEEPLSTIRTRIGFLLGDVDVWWDLDSADMKTDIVTVILEAAFPFFEKNHSLNAMEEFLVKSEVEKMKYPPPIIYLALFKVRTWRQQWSKGDAH